MPAPANDNFASATTITGASGSTSPVTIDSATTEASEPGIPGVTQSIWYSWTAPATSTVKFYVTPSIDAGRVARAAIFTGSVLASLVNLRAEFQATGAERVAFAVPVTSGTTYRLQIGVYSTPAVTGTLAMRWETVAAPANDNFANAVTLTGRAATAAAVDAVGATVEGSEPFPSAMGAGPYQTTWWKWTAPETGLARVDLTGSIGRPDNTFNEWNVGVWTGSSLGTLAEVASQDMVGDRTLQFDAVSGTNYKIQVSTWGDYDVATVNLSVLTGTLSGVVVAFDNDTFDASPFWTRLDA